MSSVSDSADIRPMRLDVLYADENFIAINKASGLLVHRTQLDKQATEFALQLLRDQIGQAVYPCHRLDRPTSGVLLFALKPAALSAAQKEFEARRVDKTYHAIVRGWPESQGLIDYDLKLEDKPSRVQTAQTKYRCLERFEFPQAIGPYPFARFAHVELKPLSGRKHQLRRHMAHLRHPILGDTRHGDGKQNQYIRQYFDCQRLLLHATRLKIHPAGMLQPIQITASTEHSFYSVLEKLRQSSTSKTTVFNMNDTNR